MHLLVSFCFPSKSKKVKSVRGINFQWFCVSTRVERDSWTYTLWILFWYIEIPEKYIAHNGYIFIFKIKAMKWWGNKDEKSHFLMCCTLYSRKMWRKYDGAHRSLSLCLIFLFKQINEQMKQKEYQQTEKYYQFRKWLWVPMCRDRSMVTELMHAHRFIDVLHELYYYYQYVWNRWCYSVMCKILLDDATSHSNQIQFFVPFYSLFSFFW